MSGSQVVVLDENERPLVGGDGTKPFSTFAIALCPVLEALTSEAFD